MVYQCKLKRLQPGQFCQSTRNGRIGTNIAVSWGKLGIIQPDLCYYADASHPLHSDTLPTALPDLVVDVQSAGDAKRLMRLKAENYLACGTRMVWLVFPAERRVEVYVPAQDVIELNAHATLEGGEVLPSFRVAVSELFAD